MGTVLHRFEIAHAQKLAAGFGDLSFLAKERKDLILNLMPIGTVFKQLEQLAIDGLCMPYLLHFEHPAFEDGTRIDLKFERKFFHKPEGGIGDCNYVTGVTWTVPERSGAV